MNNSQRPHGAFPCAFLLTFAALSAACGGSASPRTETTDSETADSDTDNDTTVPVAVVAVRYQEAFKGGAVTLDGSASTAAPGRTLTYTWSQLAGPAVTLDNPASPTPQLAAPRQSSAIVFTLVVSDGVSASAPDVATVLIRNRAPVAVAAATVTSKGAMVALDGSDSVDADGDALSFIWTQASGPAVTLVGADTATPSFVAPHLAGTLAFVLEVTDGEAEAAPVRQVVTVQNRAPVAAVATAHQVRRRGEIVRLDASPSHDEDADALTYRWLQVGGPSVQLDDVHAAEPSFVAPDADALLAFEVEISDGDDGATAAATVRTISRASSVAAWDRHPFRPEAAYARDRIFEIAVEGDRVYFAGSQHVGVFDLADASAPELLADTSTPSTSAAAIAVAAQRLYVADDTSLRIYALADPTSTALIGTYLSPDANHFLDLALAGRYAYIAHGNVGIDVIDVGDPAHPAYAGTYAAPWISRLFIAGGHLYALESTVVEILTLVAPTSPSLLGTCPVAALRGLADSDRLYLGGPGDGLRIFNIDDPTSPTEVGGLASARVGGLAMFGGHLILADSVRNVLSVLDVTDPAAPVELAALPIATAVKGLGLLGDLAVVAHDFRIAVVPLIPASPPTTGTVAMPGTAAIKSLLVDTRYAYAGCSDGLRTFDLDDPHAPHSEGVVGSAAVQGLARRGSYLYAAKGAVGVEILDVATDPRVPAHKSTVGPMTNASAVAIRDDNYGFVANGTSGLTTIVITSPSAPNIGATFATPGTAADVALVGNTAFLADSGTGGLRQIDVTAPGQMHLEASAAVSGAFAVVAKSGGAYVRSPAFLWTVSVSTPPGTLYPYDPYFLTPSPCTSGGLAIDGATVLAGDCQGLRVFAPGYATRTLAFYATPSPPVAIAPTTGYWAVASAARLSIIDRLTSPTLTLTSGVLGPSSTVTYELSWSERYPDNDEDVRCIALAGTCSVDAVDQAAHTAQITWNTSPCPGGAMRVAVGNFFYFETAQVEETSCD